MNLFNKNTKQGLFVSVFVNECANLTKVRIQKFVTFFYLESFETKIWCFAILPSVVFAPALISCHLDSSLQMARLLIKDMCLVCKRLILVPRQDLSDI